MIRRCLLISALASFGAATCQDEVCSGMGSSMLQKMSAESRQPPVTEEKGEKKVHAKKVIYREATADRESRSQRGRVQGDENPGKLRSNMDAHKEFEVEAATFAQEAEKKLDCEDEDSLATREEGHKTVDGAREEKKQRKGCKVIQTGELVAAETESVEHKSNAKHVFDGRHGGVGDTPAAGEVVTNRAKSKEIETRGKETKSKEIKRRGKETFDGDDHEAENEDTENEESSRSTEEALQEAVKKAVGHSEAATPPVTPFATKTGWEPILDEKKSARADVILAKGTGKAKKAQSKRTSKETEVGSASATKTGKRMNKLDQDRFAAIENKVKVRKAGKSHKHHKSPQHFQPSRGIREEMGPMGQQKMNRGQEDANKLTIEVGAPAAKPSTKSGAVKQMAGPVPHGAVTSPVNTGSYDIRFAKSAKHAQDGGEKRDNPCKQADGCPGGGKR